MATDIGIPVCGIVAMTGSETIPDNLMLLDGSVVDEERSLLNGMTLPNWLQNDTECIPTQCSPYDGTVYSEALYEEVTVTEAMLPSTLDEIKYDISCSVSGSSGSTGSAGDSSLYSASGNMFTASVFHSDYQATIDEGSNFDDSATYHMKMDGDTSASNLRLDNHSHSVTVKHTSNHSLTYNSSSNSYIGSSAFGYRGSDSGSKTLTVGADSSEDVTQFPLMRNTLGVRWYMRIY